MFVSYEMQDQNDVRGFIKLVKGRGTGVKDIAYASVFHLDEDMVELTQAEIEAVEQSLDATPWLDAAEEGAQRIDKLASEIRDSHHDAGSNINLEYYQIRDVLVQWRANGSIEEEAPDELLVWHEIMGGTLEAAAQDIEHRIGIYSTLLKTIRRIRLAGKHDLTTVPAEDAMSVYETTLQQLEALRGPVV